jgi:uncharacterized Zn finger protein (UPF0148 family)
MKYCPHCGAILMVGTASFCPACGKSVAVKPRKKPPPRPQTQKKPAPHRKCPPSDYDGYYRDTPTDDGGQIHERFDPALAKRIALLATGVLLIIALAVLAMYFL